jgi:hypothetical protein
MIIFSQYVHGEDDACIDPYLCLSVCSVLQYTGRSWNTEVLINTYTLYKLAFGSAYEEFGSKML